RQIVLDGAKVFAGQALLTPSHTSGTSQTPAEARHTVPDGLFTSAGQVALLPVQVSAGSQAPAEARQTWLEFSNLQFDLQHGPGGSQSSPLSTTLLPQVASVNVVCVICSEPCPVAVRVNVTPRSP